MKVPELTAFERKMKEIYGLKWSKKCQDMKYQPIIRKVQNEKVI